MKYGVFCMRERGGGKSANVRLYTKIKEVYPMKQR